MDATTLTGKLMFGYQGWFGCPDDGSQLARWEHWFRAGQPAGEPALRVDMWPDLSELPESERCATPMPLPEGRTAQLYSAYRGAAVDMHFHWMQEYGLPGVFLQRFTSGLTRDATRDFRDTVARNVRSAAETNGRVFALMYDISGHVPETLVDDVKRDWAYLVDTLRITESERYLRHNGRPLLAIWGFGFKDRPATPSQAAELIDFFKNNPDPRYRVTLLGGIPAGWRTLTRDSLEDAAWAGVYRSFDIVSPWTVGRFRDDEGVDRFYRDTVVPDVSEARAARIEYMPVVFPGFSWRNMNRDAAPNQIPRRGGRFWWRQAEQAIAAGNTMLYGAMFDEVDEGTAMFKLATTAEEVPADASIVTLDADGEALPSDWYLQLSREAQVRLQRIGVLGTGPNSYRLDIQSQPQPQTWAASGTTVWGGRGGRGMQGFQAQQAIRRADLGAPLKMTRRYPNLTVNRYATVEDRNTIVLVGRPSADTTEQLHFDRETGLLLRRSISTRTAFSPVAEQIDYSDYRDASGVKMPFTIRYASWNDVQLEKFTDIKVNVPIDDARFAMPPQQQVPGPGRGAH